MDEHSFEINDDYDHVDDSIEYILENVLCDDDKTTEYKHLKDLYHSILSDSCACKCKSNNCKECHHGGNYLRDEFKIILKNIEQIYPIYECFGSCSCDIATCNNRAVQFGPRKHLQVVYLEKYKSYGLVTNKQIQKGEFVCEYAGELLTKKEAITRFASNAKCGNMNYILYLKEYSSLNGDCFYAMIVDPSRKGNIGRYLNHSCEPNCCLYTVRVDCAIPKIAIFAAKSIAAGEELCFDYGCSTQLPAINEHSSVGRISCLCGTQACKGYLPYHDFEELS